MTTNILAGLLLTFTTNRVGSYSLPDGGHLCEYQIIANAECNHQMPDGVIQFTAQSFYSKFSQIEPPPPAPPPQLLPPNRSSRIIEPPGMPFNLLPPRFANGGPDEQNFCPMFRVDFPTETNRIYRLEASHDLVNWEPRPPEIDGTGEPDRFFDAGNGGESYRVMSRDGVLSN